MEKDFYTELIYRCKHPDSAPDEITVKRGAWDLDMGDFLNMFHGIAISATYLEKSFERSLVEYLEERGYTVYGPEEKCDEQDA